MSDHNSKTFGKLIFACIIMTIGIYYPVATGFFLFYMLADSVDEGLTKIYEALEKKNFHDSLVEKMKG